MSNSAVAEIVKSADSGHGYYTDDSDLGRYNTVDQAVAEKMTVLVKGAGYRTTEHTPYLGALPGANRPLADPDAVFGKAMEANRRWKSTHAKAFSQPDEVRKSLSPDFAAQFGAFAQASPQNAMMGALVASLQQQVSAALNKNIDLTAPLASGFVPFNLVSPSRLIYPVN